MTWSRMNKSAVERNLLKRLGVDLFLCAGTDNASLTYAYDVNCTREIGSETGEPKNMLSSTLVFILLVVCVFGVVGNVLSYIALSKDRSKHRNTILLLKVLAVGDTMNLVARIMEAVMFIVRQVCRLENPAIIIVDMLAFLMVDIGQCLATWLVFPVTLERYIFIRHPLKAARFISLSRTRILVGILIAVILVFNVPNMIYFSYICLGHFPQEALTSAYSHLHDFVESRFMFVYWHYLKTLFAVVLPLLVLLFLNGILIYSLRQMQQHQAPNDSSTQNGPAKILITIVTILLLCQSPSAVLQGLYLGGVTIPATVLQPLGATLLVLNSACNFLIYCAFGKRFRGILKDMILCRDSGDKDHVMTGSGYSMVTDRRPRNDSITTQNSDWETQTTMT